MAERPRASVEYTPERTLTGGLRIDAHKMRSTQTAIRKGPMPSRLVLATHQHRGAPAVPDVEVGQHVRKLERIARAEAPRSAAVHAPTSGRVVAIEQRDVPLGHALQRSPCIVIEPDGRDERAADGPGAWPADRAAQLERIRASGLVGLGGAVFPTAEKLAAQSPCMALIVNGAECEPFISCDDMLMREAPREIVEGVILMADLLDAPHCIIALERDKRRAIEAVRAAIRERGDARLSLAELPTIYPAGGERQLIELLTGSEVPADRFPSEIGYPCQNVGTAFALRQYAREGEPLVSRIVTVTGRGIRDAANVEVLIGTPIDELVELCGGYTEDVCRLILGGSMMGYALPNDGLPVTKASNCIIAATPDEVRTDTTEWACIRCGECSTACPARLQPQELLRAAHQSDFRLLRELGLTDCIECGCCDVICPSHIPLTEVFRGAKREHAAHERKLAFSAESEHRYRERQRRREQRESETERLQHELIEHVESDPESASETIQAAVERARRRKRKDRQES